MAIDTHEPIGDQNPQIPTAREVVEVGWSLLDFPATVIWNDPEPFSQSISSAPPWDPAQNADYNPTATQRTRAHEDDQDLDYNARYIVITSPIDMHLRFFVDQSGRPNLQNLDGERSSVRDYFLNQMIQITSPNEWRHPERPILQVMTPYIFMADSPVYINQFPAFMSFAPNRLPGLLIDGRFPIDIWPRQLMWAFEWYDTKAEINIKRGDPWFYAYFETQHPSCEIRLVESEITPEVKKYITSITGVSNYVKQTYSLFATARRRRPERLVFPKYPSNSN